MRGLTNPTGERSFRASGTRGSGSRVGAWLLFFGLLPLVVAASARGEETLQALRLRGLTARPAALLMSGQSGGEIPLAVLALPVPTAGDEIGLAVVVETGLQALAAGGEGDLRSEIYVYATDAASAPRSSLTQTFTVPAAKLAPDSGLTGLRFLGHLELAPGQYDLRVLILGRTPERFGLYRTPLVVPDFAGEAPALLPPLLQAPAEDGWVRVREAPHGKVRQDLLALAGLSYWPAARPVLPPDWEGELLVLGRRLGPLPGDLSGRLVSIDEAPLGQSPLVSATLAAASGSLESWRLKVRLEPSGVGAARWSWKTEVDGASVPPAREVWLSASGPSSRPWPQLQGTGPVRTSSPIASVPRSQAQPREDPGRLSEEELASLLERFPQLLRRWLQGEGEAAMGELLELEASVVSGRSLAGVEALREAELQALRRAAGSSPESFVPVAWLYIERFESYIAQRQFLLAAHARLLVRKLLDLFVESNPGGDSKRLAADLFTAYGQSLQTLSLSTESEAAFRRALELDPTQVGALRGLVASHERARQDDRAITYLEQWLALNPMEGEACARLGRIQLRNDRKLVAESTFRRCLKADGPAWAVAVAYQELALLLGRLDRWGEAASLLEEGVQALPDQARLKLLRAYALDRLQKPAAGRQALATLSSPSLLAGDSPRARYGRFDRETAREFRGRLEVEIHRYRGVLLEILDKEVSP